MALIRGICTRCSAENTRLYGIAPNKYCWRCLQKIIAHPCACGCGFLTKNAFINGHNTRTLSSEEQGRRGKFNLSRDWSDSRHLSEKCYQKVMGQHLHRIVAENKIGRKLQKGEIVHHIDGNKHNNHPDNLEVMTQSEHCKTHHFGKRKLKHE